jgi:hypothetical protein
MMNEAIHPDEDSTLVVPSGEGILSDGTVVQAWFPIEPVLMENGDLVLIGLIRKQ